MQPQKPETRDVRRKFLEYFKKNNHAIIASSPVIPYDDPTLLFINAGMNQFKDVFLGKSVRDYKRATTCQKCIRAGGKHNDLENVGHTKRHLTFLEMLGNFSFGDYFKEKAIQFAWEVSTEVFQLDPARIWPTIFLDDDEAFELWKKYVPIDRITRLGEKDNFWSMGDTGPCGPCSELYYDRGSHFSHARSPLEDPNGDRFLEFWNLVFMQFNKKMDGSLEKLPKQSIDTGSGLERVMSLIQNVDTVYETDILRSIIASIEMVSGKRYDPKDKKIAPAFHVIADHLRSLSFAIADGAQPSNVERGYVLRKILRRAVRYGKILGFEEPFLAKVLPSLIYTMGQDYKELAVAENRIVEIITQEEEAFFRTLRRGGNILSQIIEVSTKHQKEISGDDAFKLKDTYGLPLEEVLLIAKDYDLQVDVPRFEQLEKEAKEKSKIAQKTKHQIAKENLFEEFVQKEGECHFVRDRKKHHKSTIIGLIRDGNFVESLEEGQDGMVILKETPFYAEMGGQIGDTGILHAKGITFKVSDCQAPFKGVITHIGTLEAGTLQVGQEVDAQIDEERRQKIANNHTATHLLHWALHKVLGEHARQAGSVVDPFRLRFDFSHHKAMTEDEIREIEHLVNTKIRQNLPVAAYELSYEEAHTRHDIKQFFGEKYGSVVRVIDIDFSKELCGGTHTSHTGNIGYFRILKESSIAAGVRRIEAITGEEAENLSYKSDDAHKAIAKILGCPEQKIIERLQKMQEEQKNLQTQLKNAQKSGLKQLSKELLRNSTAKGTIYCINSVQVAPDELRVLAEEIANDLPSGVIGLGCVDDTKAHLFIRISQDLVGKGLKANELIKNVLPIIEGNGGGKSDSAQGAGKAKDKLTSALERLLALLP